MSSDIPEYNVLLLGETGCGKSTTINSFANYLEFASFEEANCGKFIELVSSKFALSHPDTDQPVIIQSNIENDNECFDGFNGSSVTQAPRAYVFKCNIGSNEVALRFIDTPGLGDTGGIAKDRENFKQILAFLSKFKQLHGIIIILKTHESRQHAYKYCLSELLFNLHKSACDNIVFCFTFSRNSFYGPGDAFYTLKSFLDKNFDSNLGLHLESNKNCFFIDNEAFRFLVAKKQNYPFTKSHEKEFEDSWNNSVEQSIKMWQKILQNEPHQLDETISLNNVRKLIFELAEPIARILYFLRKNIYYLKEKEKELKNIVERKEKEIGNILIEVEDLEMRPLNFSRTVCTSSKCTDVIQFQGKLQILYKKVCHDNCLEVDSKSNLVGDSLLKSCNALKNGDICKICGCKWQKHMRFVTQYFKVKRQIFNTSIEKELISIDTVVEAIKNAIAAINKTVKEFYDELTVIENIILKFELFNILNNIDNNFMGPYFDLFIEEEKKKNYFIPNYSHVEYSLLESIQKHHSEITNIDTLKKAIANQSHENVKMEDIFKYKEQLLRLKNCGPQLERIMNTTECVKERFKDSTEKQLDFPDEKTVKNSKKPNFWQQFWGNESGKPTKTTKNDKLQLQPKSGGPSYSSENSMRVGGNFTKKQFYKIDIFNEMDKIRIRQPPKRTLSEMSKRINGNLTDKHCDEINILILGETGTGKSTTINALGNYLKFESFEEALSANEFMNLIPSKFSLPHPETGEPFVIEDGENTNEQHQEEGYSRTQSPWGYVFKFGDRIIRLIDTPGMGNSRGIEADKENFDKIIYYLRHHMTLHGIIVLVKASETRTTASFKYCLSELLTHLHRDACRNIAFCFTHSRNTFYEPGDGFSVMKAFLNHSEFSNNLQLKPGVNCFFIDNEAYRFLVAKKHGYLFPDDKIRLYKESWDKSVVQTEIMMRRFMELEPHNIEYSTLLNSAMKLMLNLEKPLVEIQKLTNENIDSLKYRLDQIKVTRNQDNVKLQLFDAELEPLDHPQLVCTELTCVKKIIVDGDEKDIFKTRCHKKCKIEGVETNMIGHPLLQKCGKLSNGMCSKCGCSWTKHMHLKYRFRRVERVVFHDQERQESENPDKMIQRLIKEYKQEFAVIQEIAAKFAQILNENANSHVNKYIEPYLDLLIEQEELKLRECLNYSRKALNSLKEMKAAHIKSLKILQYEDANEQTKKVNIKDVNTLRDQLCNLKRTGATFRKIIHTTMPREFDHPETHYPIF